MIALLIAGAFSMAFTLFLTPLFIRLFKRLGWGQFIRDDGVAGEQLTHHTKRGTATMGGIVFLVGGFLGYLVGHWVAGVPWTMVGVLVFGMAFGLGLVGFIDDFTKTRKQRSLGIGGWTKILGQVIVGSVFAVFAITENFRDENGLTPASTNISGVRDISWLNLAAFGAVIGFVLFVLWVNVITTSTSNAVNVTDGLDGLAAGASIFAIGAYIFIGFWQSNQSCFNEYVIGSETYFKCYEVRDPIDLAVAAAALCGALDRLPLVEHLARPDLHGRHRLDGSRRRPRRSGDPQPHRTAARADLGPLHHHDRVGDPPAVLVQVHETGVRHPASYFLDEPAAASLRTQGLGRGHDRRAVLDHRRALRRRRRWPVLSGMGQSLMANWR